MPRAQKAEAISNCNKNRRLSIGKHTTPRP
jgi:hypothetical protein